MSCKRAEGSTHTAPSSGRKICQPVKGVTLIGVKGRDMAERVLWRCHKRFKCQNNLFPESPELPGETGRVRCTLIIGKEKRWQLHVH